MFGCSSICTRVLNLLLRGFLVFLLMPFDAYAEDMYVTPFVGYRAGGDVEDAASGSTVDIDESDTQGLIVGWEMQGGEFEIIYSRQATELTAGSSVADDVLVDVEISQLLGSGKLILDPELGGYFGFMLGLTHFDFDGAAYESDTRFAMGIEGGIDYPLTDSISLRLGLRGVVTLVDTDDDAFCESSSDCPIEVSDNVLEQYELFSGLTIRF